MGFFKNLVYVLIKTTQMKKCEYLSLGICVLFIFLMVTETSWIQSQPLKLSANLGRGTDDVRASFTLLGGIKMSLSNADFITIIFCVEEIDEDFFFNS